MVLHLFERSVGVFRLFDAHDFHLVELVQAVQSPHILAITAGFAAEASAIGTIFFRQCVARYNHIAVDVGNGHFGSGNQVEVIHLAVIHLSFLVGQLTGAKPGGFVHHVRRLNFGVAGFVRLIEEELNERPLQACALADIYRESGAGDFHAQVKIDKVVFLRQIPVRERVIAKFRHIASGFFHHIIVGSFAFGHPFVGHIRHRKQNFFDLCFNSGELVVDIFVTCF